jgi:hypothetical protein
MPSPKSDGDVSDFDLNHRDAQKRPRSKSPSDGKGVEKKPRKKVDATGTKGSKNNPNKGGTSGKN